MDITAVWLTLRLAVLTTAILLVLGIPLAWWLSSSRWRGKFLVEATVALPLVLPPTVLGFYILMATGPNSVAGQWYQTITGGILPFSFQGILLGSLLYNLPFAVRPFTAAFDAVDRRLMEASWCLGVSRAATFFRVSLPQARPGILTGVVLCFAHAIGEFGVVLMLGGNIPGITRTLSVAIYDDVQALDYAAAGQTAFYLLAFSFIVLAVTYARHRRVVAL